jgi:phospholipid-binding lipoprotein MlaA
MRRNDSGFAGAPAAVQTMTVARIRPTLTGWRRAAAAWWRAATWLALAGMATGCATIPPNAGQTAGDPFERFNRHVFAFNDGLDRAVLKPTAQAYSKLPEGVRDCVGNVFANLAEVPNAVNDLLQGKPASAVSDVCRFVINSTVGLAGCFDVATKIGLTRNQEDFGQTLGRWGAGPGAYLVLPLFGPSDVRDAFGKVADIFTDPLDYLTPLSHRYVGTGVRIVDLRASVLDAEKIVEGAALDRYSFLRDAYLQRRRNLVYDGEPPRVKYDDDDGGPEPAAAPGAGAPPGPPAQPDAVAPAPSPSPPVAPAPPPQSPPAPESPAPSGTPAPPGVPAPSVAPAPPADAGAPAGARAEKRKPVQPPPDQAR